MAHWTQERSDLAASLWTKGHSAGEIARTLGGCTRNAVIGRLYRIGLSGKEPLERQRTRREARTKYHHRRKKPKIAEITAAQAAERAARSQALRERAENQAGPDLLRPANELVKLVDLEFHHCRWPYGEPKDGLSCGLKKVPGLSYCDFHARRAYMPVQPTRTLHPKLVHWLDGTLKSSRKLETV